MASFRLLHMVTEHHPGKGLSHPVVLPTQTRKLHSLESVGNSNTVATVLNVNY